MFDGTLAELEALQITLAANPGGGFQNVVNLGNFEAGETPFQWSTSFSGSNHGILTGSDAIRTTNHSHEGNAAQAINIVGDTTDWFLRHVSGNASPAASPTTNTPFASTGFVGFWLKTEDAGITVSLAVDDIGSSVDRGVGLEVVADGRWHLYEWDLNDESQWEGWTSGANGIIDGLTVTIDSIQFSGAGNVSLYLDSVAHNPDGSLLSAPGDFNYDGDVDADDLSLWQANFGINTGAAMNDGDADGDGDVDGRDFLAWQKNYQPTSSPDFVAVPEPALLTLVAMFALVGLAHRSTRAISRVTTAA